MRINDDDKTIERLVEAVLLRNDCIPYARLAARRPTPIGKFAAWLMYGSQPDFPDSEARSRWQGYLGIATDVSINRAQFVAPEKFMKSELLRWGRIGGWPTKPSEGATQLIHRSNAGGYGPYALFNHLWIASPVGQELVGRGVVPDYLPKSFDCASALLQCISRRLLRLPAERIDAFRAEFIELFGKQGDRRVVNTQLEYHLFHSQPAESYSSIQLNTMSGWNAFAASELARRREPLDDPNGKNVASWINGVVKDLDLFRPVNLDYLLSTYSLAGPIAKYALWQYASTIQKTVPDPEEPFSGRKLRVTELLGNQPPLPGYEETARFFSIIE